MKPYLLLIAFLFSALAALAQYPRWTKPSGDWSDASGWSTGQVPPREETVEIGIGCEVIVTTEIFAGIIYVNGEGKINIAQSGTLHVNRSGGLGAVRMLDKSKLIVSGKLYMGDRYPLFGDGIVGNFYRSFRWERPDIIVNKTGLISVGNTTGIPIMLFTGGSITNHGTIEIGNFGPIGFDDGANVSTMGIMTVGAPFVNTGVLTIDDIQARPSMPNGTPGMLLSAGFKNSGQVRIGQKARIEGPAFVVSDTTENSGVIVIDNAKGAMSVDTLLNTGQIKIGQNGVINGRGLYTEATDSYIVNQGDILVDGTISGDAISLAGAKMINQKNIFVGKTRSIGGSGISLASAILDNRTNGVIQVEDCASHSFRLSNGANVINSGLAETGGDQNAGNDAIYLNNSTFVNNAGSLVKLDKAKKNGVRLIKGRFDNRGMVRVMETDSIPVFLQNASTFDNSGTVDASADNAPFSAGIAITGGSVFNNRPAGAITLNRISLISNLPALYIRDDRSRFTNDASVTIGDGTSPLLYPAIVADQQAALVNERSGLIKIVNIQQSGLAVTNESEFANSGTVEFHNVAGIPLYGSNQSHINSEGFIKTGLGSVFSKESIYLEGGSDFQNRPHGEIYINRTGSPFAGMLVKGGTGFQNDGKIVWGNGTAFQGTAALQLASGGFFNNRNSAVLEFTSCTGDAIVCDAVTGAMQNSNFTNDGTVRFGSIGGRGFYNIDPTFLFRNNNVFETLPGGKMNLQALVGNAAPSSKLTNVDGTVTTGLAFSNSGTVTNGGTFNSYVQFTNSSTIANNGTWNASGVFNNNQRYQGSGAFQGTVFNNKAVLAPGNSPGCTSFGNGLTAQPGSIFQIEVNGKVPCTQFDQINVTGTATIAGQLNVTLGGGYIPGDYDAVTILKSTALSGTFSGTNLPAGWIVVYNKPAVGDITLSRITALPLRLIQFTIKRDGNTAHASWATTDEVNTSYFDLERSTDGSRFEKIGTIAAINEPGDHHYDFTDKDPLPSRSYYRLKMADMDGTYTHSRIVVFDGEKTGAAITAIYPNPAKDIVNLKVEGISSGMTFQLVSQSGKTLTSRSLTANGILSVDVSGIPAGVYILKVSNGKTYKLVKQ